MSSVLTSLDTPTRSRSQSLASMNSNPFLEDEDDEVRSTTPMISRLSRTRQTEPGHQGEASRPSISNNNTSTDATAQSGKSTDALLLEVLSRMEGLAKKVAEIEEGSSKKTSKRKEEDKKVRKDEKKSRKVSVSSSLKISDSESDSDSGPSSSSSSDSDEESDSTSDTSDDDRKRTVKTSVKTKVIKKKGTSKMRLKPDSLPRFFGSKTDDVEDWLERVNAIYEGTNCEEGELLASLPLILKGKAFRWYYKMRKRNKRSLTLGRSGRKSS
jgi:hypothetical protein